MVYTRVKRNQQTLFSVAVVSVLQPAGNSASQELPLKRGELALRPQDCELPAGLSWGCLLARYTECSSRKPCSGSFGGGRAVTPQQVTAEVHSSFC